MKDHSPEVDEPMENLKQNHPEKYCMKIVFHCLYYLGMGDSWYETSNRSKIAKKLYSIWAIIANGYAVGIICNEMLAYTRKDLSDIEKNDLVQFTFAHLSILAKIVSFYIYKSKIKLVFKKLLEDTRSVFFSEEMDRQSVKKFMRYSMVLVAISYVALFTTTVDGVRAHFKEGVPIRIEVIFYPRAIDSGLFINILRFFIEFHWWYIVAMMAGVDCLAVASLVFVSFRFKRLQLYFQQMRKKVERNQEKVAWKVLQEEFKKDFVVGVKLHEHAMWCAHNAQNALGSLYNVQVFETVALLIMCLVKLVTTEHNLIFLLATFAYISCLIVLTGSYMMPAGDITYEASLVPTAMFHSGWELVRADSKLQVLAVFAIQRSQVPVYMTAFGIMTLSYTNFISVLRSSYSFFAVMY